MKVNKERPHVLVLPEDDANRQIVNGFLLDPSLNERAIQVLPIAGGWVKVRENMCTTQATQLRNFPNRHLVLLIDFDGHVIERTQMFEEAIPADVRDRVYLLGTQVEPERLRKACRVSWEKIGEQLANACANGEQGLWGHAMLVHNQAEVGRLIANVKPFLFK